ncbi:tetratricopeptide repeat-containing sensor histidine kinase [Fulvivirga sp. M361]|uniref:tetratricopeptide repeat-containing sensor histidine kinase n=1 Tax=Fulvivirga sp. M361 TaxID=2594266 RepID=UPI001627C81E|nr:tetratricopeptide repeat-containing sensor histidine kinase [Fulvivirga sp. M361]
MSFTVRFECNCPGMLRLCIIFIVISLFTEMDGYGQNYAPVKYYLIDSLDLQNVSQKDRLLIDSVLNIYHGSRSDTTRINAISVIVEESWDDNVWPKYNQWVHDFIAGKLGQESDSATLHHFKKAYAGALNNIGYLYNSKGESDQALAYYDKTLKIQQEIQDKPGMAGTFINTGYIFLNQGLIEKALEYYYNSLKIEEEIQNQRGIATALNGIGYINYKQGETGKAFESYNRSLTIRTELNDEYGIATCLNNIGLIFKDLGEWDKALEYYQKCLVIEDKLGDKTGIAISKGNIGAIYKSLGELEKALKYYAEGLEIRKGSDDKLGISHSLNSMADIMLLQGDLKDARIYAMQSLVLAKELDYPIYIRDAAETLTNVARKENQWQEAFKYYQLYIQMRDSVFNEETITATIHQKYKYKYEKEALADSIRDLQRERMKEAQLAASEAEKERLLLRAEKQKQQTIFLTSSLILVILFIGFVYNRLKFINGQKKIIQEQKGELEEMNQELRHFASVTSHDLKTPLRGIANLVSMIENDYPNLEGDLKKYFGLMRERAVKMNELINGILAYSKAGKQRVAIERVNVNTLLESIIDHINNENGVEIKVMPNIPDLLCNKTQLEQVLSNLISNAVKYNHKDKNNGQVEVNYSSQVNFHEFTVSDNGPGIPKNAQSSIFELFKKSHNKKGIDSSGIGLSIVKKLVSQNGGKITLTSDLGKGSSFKFTWPK